MIWGDYSSKEIKDIYYHFTEDRKKSESMAKIIMGLREEFGVNN